MPIVHVAGGPIEYERLGSKTRRPSIVMLHEGLGSIALWKDFPRRLAESTDHEVVVYSRHGYGNSAPLAGSRNIEYMREEALIVLPALLDELNISEPILFGHSDGASIALIYAGGSQRATSGVVALAPHIFVEDISVTSIQAAKVAFQHSGLKERLAPYHSDVAGAFWGWNDVWLHPDFRAWNIEEYLSQITCPILAMQGENDEYGTMAQLDGIARQAPRVELLRLPACRHSPHRDQPAAVLAAVTDWTYRLDAAAQSSASALESSVPQS